MFDAGARKLGCILHVLILSNYYHYVMFLVFFFFSPQILALVSVKRPIGANPSSYQTLMHMGVRLATWNQILDPWVYILLRRTVLGKIYLIVKCQAGMRGGVIGRWEKSSFPSMDQKEVSKV